MSNQTPTPIERNWVTLETAKKLKVAGFPQKTVTIWEWSDGIPLGEAYLWQPEVMKRYGLWGSQDVKDSAAAPTAQEIADQLPVGPSDSEHGNSDISVERAGSTWVAVYRHIDMSSIEDRAANGPTICEALAALYLKLHSEEAK